MNVCVVRLPDARHMRTKKSAARKYRIPIKTVHRFKRVYKEKIHSSSPNDNLSKLI